MDYRDVRLGVDRGGPQQLEVGIGQGRGSGSVRPEENARVLRAAIEHGVDPERPGLPFEQLAEPGARVVEQQVVEAVRAGNPKDGDEARAALEEQLVEVLGGRDRGRWVRRTACTSTSGARPGVYSFAFSRRSYYRPARTQRRHVL